MTESATSNHAIISGYLMKKKNAEGKKSFLGPKYQRRWFELTHATLTYAAEAKDIKFGDGRIEVFAVHEMDGFQNLGGRKFSVSFPERLLVLKAASDSECDSWLTALQSVQRASSREGRPGSTPTASARVPPASSLRLSVQASSSDSDDAPSRPGSGTPAAVLPPPARSAPTAGSLRRTLTATTDDEFAQPPSPRTLLANPQLAMRFMAYQAEQQAAAAAAAAAAPKPRYSDDVDGKEDAAAAPAGISGREPASAGQKPLRLAIPGGGSGVPSPKPVPVRAPSREMNMLILDPADVYGVKPSVRAAGGGILGSGSILGSGAGGPVHGGGPGHQRKHSVASSNGRLSHRGDSDILENWDSDDDVAATPSAVRRSPGVAADVGFVDSDWDSPVSGGLAAPPKHLQPPKLVA